MKMMTVKQHLINFLNYHLTHKKTFKTHDIQDLSVRGVEKWGYRLGGIQKQQHEDWTTFTPEMLVRCKKDTQINLNYLPMMNEIKSYRRQKTITLKSGKI